MKRISKDFVKKVDKTGIIKLSYHKMRGLKGLIKYYIGHKAKLFYAQKYHSLPLENKVVFANFNGRGYGCNPKYIAQEIISQKLPYDLVWLVSENDNNMPAMIRQVPFEGDESFKELATAKVIINNVKGDLNFKKREGQHYIQTWHGGYSFKYLEKDAANKLPKDYLLESKYNSLDSDLFLSNSIIQSEEYRRAFWCTCEILDAGLPRNDIFFTSDDEHKKIIRQSIKLDNDIFTVLFAPTFRSDNDTFESYGLDFRRLINAVQARFGGNWKLMVKLHPNVNILDNCLALDNVINVSQYPDMQDLLYIADILITDYSSTMFDMMEMGKKVFLFANDIEEYQSLRGLKPSYFELPLHISKDNDELEKCIGDFNEDSYKYAIQTINSMYATYDKGTASASVVEKIKEWMK